MGVRQPAWPPSNANGKHTYGKPVMLVGPGAGMDVWAGQTPGKTEGWKIVDGALVNEPPTYNPISKEKFTDFKIETEFNLDQGQNSGLYLRGDTNCNSRSAWKPGHRRSSGPAGDLRVEGCGRQRREASR